MKRIYRNGMILNGHEDMEPISNMEIVTEDDKIIKICPTGTENDGEVIDLQGKYIMPGLINMHVHIPGSGNPPKEKETDNKKLVKILTANALTRFFALQLQKGFIKTDVLSGVTTIRTVGGIQDFDTQLRDLVAAGKVVGPRILASNMAISVPNGHMAGSLAYEARSAEEAKMYVDRILEDNPDLIKLMITGGVLDAEVKGEPGVLKMAPELVKAACDEAKAHGKYVSAHAESTEGIKVALQNGVTSIEHGAKPDEEMMQLFKDKDAFLILTLSPAMYFAEFDPAMTKVDEVAVYNGTVLLEGMIECAKKCLENGIPVGLGTDTGCPYVMHDGMWRELMYFVKYCGVTNQFALYTATKRNSELAGISDITGTLEEGKCADMIVTNENPLENLETLRQPVMVVASGHLYKDPKPKHNPIVDQEMDKYIR